MPNAVRKNYIIPLGETVLGNNNNNKMEDGGKIKNLL